MTDVTERKRAERGVQQRSEDLARSNADLEQFAYVASHDLQEPLRAVAGSVQLLQRRYQGQLDARADEFITHAVEGTSRMQQLIDDLLAFSRVGTRGDRLRPCDSGRALDAALGNLAVAIRESGAVITRDPLPTVAADISQLTSLLQNLIGNAIKFRGAAPLCIHVGAAPQGGEWVFSVRDTGIGIEPQYFERIFGVFQRLHTRREYPGTGIGLAICRKIVERHGGRIWVESELGEGSTFYFTLPGASGDQGAEA
jgi:light-regulated signal transduction histidine kinase (bacteriophytochrome)